MPLAPASEKVAPVPLACTSSTRAFAAAGTVLESCTDSV